jgi:outer membrane murein-binding lipoprotein Lpp
MTSGDHADHAEDKAQVAKASPSPDQIKGAAAKIGEALGETSPKPVAQIRQLIEKCGLPFVEKIMAETEAIEAEGGLLTHDRKRRRSKGGVFFYLAKGQMDAELRAQIFPNFGKGGDGTIAPPGIDWEERVKPMKALRPDAGQISGLMVTLSGRPRKLHIDGSSVMTVLEQRQVKAPPYPKGVPHFDTIDGITSYYVFMSLRHWRRVEKALEDETDLLVVEGSAVYDAALEGVTILSTRVSTKKLDYQKRKAKTLSAQAGATPTAKDATTEREAAANDEDDMTGLPPETAEKLRQLHGAADKLRQKLVTMEAGGQVSGLKMTRRLLKQTEKQIATLRMQNDK